MKMEVKKEYLEWLNGYDSGTSSRTILSLLTGIPVREHDIPYDMADIGRCVRMLRKFPELRERLGEIIDKDVSWMPFIDCWKELERGYDECQKYLSITDDELKKLKRRKSYFDAPGYYYSLLKKLEYTSKYLKGYRAQNSHCHLKLNTPPKSF